MSRKIRVALVAFGLAWGSVSSATETITYTYDAQGRLIKVVRTGTTNNNNQACYKYDAAGNRIYVQASVGSQFTCP